MGSMVGTSVYYRTTISYQFFFSSLKCPVAAHWKCLASTQRDEILKATLQRDREEWLKQHEGEDVDVIKDGPRKRPTLAYDQTTEFICGS